MKKQLIHLTKIQSFKHFSSRQSSCFSMEEKCLMLTYATKNTKKMCTRVLNFNKINNFCCFTKDILRCVCVLFLLQSVIEQGSANYHPQVKPNPQLLFIEIQPCSFIYTLSADDFALQMQSLVIETETAESLKHFLSGPWREK